MFENNFNLTQIEFQQKLVQSLFHIISKKSNLVRFSNYVNTYF